ncbi:LOW QUALITY PROTEIN: putative inorganic phosphate cotransporter [Pollicipes pollicipes]|uniref:LOW QUALITY PROTEIN: putative inorganic phosphate cotransporter n=1 Tax=Pollicipes pollicipes TaxID=41117 RepID=UPI001884E8F4|nr:LOW QUALITY PROTEIN: putative inorganic phosphate cotransporter [Pollicipes pollicipes]
MPKGRGARHTLALFGCRGLFVSYALRVNMSMAIVAMVNGTCAGSDGDLQQHPHRRRTTSARANRSWQLGPELPEDGPFVWSELTQGVILSAYFAGYTVSQVPGGRLAERVGAVRTLAGGIGATGLLTLLTPVCALYSLHALVAVRALQGLASGVVTPAVHCLLARWVPPLERSRISTFVYVGKQLGTAVTILVAGPLASWSWGGGWQAIFYVTGGLSLVWCVLWLLLVHERPADHPPHHLQESASTSTPSPGRPLDFPWKQALLSRPFQALVVVHFCENWGDYLIMTELPTYISTALRYPLNTNAMFSALPQLAKVAFAVGVSFVADWMARGRLSLTANRKLWNSVGLYIPALALVGVSFAGCHDALVLSLMVVTVGFNGGVLSGYNINHMDLAPNFAGTLMGLTNCVATLAGVLAPFQAGYVLNQQPSLANWRTVFLTAAGLFAFGNTVFCLFGSTQLQPWNDPLPTPCLLVEEDQQQIQRRVRQTAVL